MLFTMLTSTLHGLHLELLTRGDSFCFVINFFPRWDANVASRICAWCDWWSWLHGECMFRRCSCILRRKLS